MFHTRSHHRIFLASLLVVAGVGCSDSNGPDPVDEGMIDGVQINLTRERVRQIECEALRKIKEHIVD